MRKKAALVRMRQSEVTVTWISMARLLMVSRVSADFRSGVSGCGFRGGSGVRVAAAGAVVLWSRRERVRCELRCAEAALVACCEPEPVSAGRSAWTA